MTAGALVIELHQPRGERWRELVDEWYVDSVGEALSMPPNLIVIRLTPEVTMDQARDVANEIRSLLEEGTVTIEHREIDE